MTSAVHGTKEVIRFLSNLERRAHGAARRAVGETTRQVQLGIRAEVNSIFRKNAKAGNAIRSVVYDNTQARGTGPGRGFLIDTARLRHRADTAGIVFSKFGSRTRNPGRYTDYLLPYITGQAILPKKGRYLAIPLLPGRRWRKPRPDMNLAPVFTRGQLYLVQHMKRKSVFAFLLLKKITIRRRLRLASVMSRGGRTLTGAVIKEYAALAGEMRR